MQGRHFGSRERELPFCTCGLQVRHSGFRFKLPLVEGMGKTDALLVLRLGSGAQVFFNDRELASQLVKALSARAGEVRWEQKPLEMKDPGEHREDCQGSRSRQELRVCGHVIVCTDPINRIGKNKAVDADPLFENDPWEKFKARRRDLRRDR